MRNEFEGLHNLLTETERAIDRRLSNWAAVVRGSGRGGCSPMWRMARSSDARSRGTYAAAVHVPADAADGWLIERQVAAMARRWPQHAGVLRWYYVHGGAPEKAARLLECAAHELVALLRSARASLGLLSA